MNALEALATIVEMHGKILDTHNETDMRLLSMQSTNLTHISALQGVVREQGKLITDLRGLVEAQGESIKHLMGTDA